MKNLSHTLVGLAFVATAAQAQQAERSAADGAAPGTKPAGAGAAASAFTDAEIDSFARATIKLQAINANTALDATQKQAQMVAAVQEAGLDAETYNAMGKAAQEDAALLSKMQTAITRHVQPSEG